MEQDRRSTKPWADLVIAILSVNNYPLDKTWNLFDGLEENGLFDPRVLAGCDLSELARRLGAAGYDRGDAMTAMFTDRLAALGRLAREVPVDRCERILSSGTRDEVVSFLAGVRGIGPKVLENYFRLRGER